MNVILTAGEWKNQKRDRVDDPEKAEYMARVENEWRESIQTLSDIAIRAVDPEVSQDLWKVIVYQARVFGPGAVERAAEDWENYHNPILPMGPDEVRLRGVYAVGGRRQLKDN